MQYVDYQDLKNALNGEGYADEVFYSLIESLEYSPDDHDYPGRRHHVDIFED